MDRTSIENEYTSKLSTILEKRKKRLIWRDGGFYDTDPENRDLSDVLFLLLLAGLMYGISSVTDTIKILDEDIIKAVALEWANGYSFGMVSGINTITAEAIREATMNVINGTMTTSEAIDSLSRYFSADRAKAIVVTETTRAMEKGKHFAMDQFLKENKNLRSNDVWSIADEGACNECSPLAGLVRGNGWTDDPPLHPWCRCSVIYEVSQK